MLAHHIRRTLERLGFDISLADGSVLEPEFQNILAKCRPFTMASRERLYAVFQAAQYIVRNGIPGDIVECGVWRGGACMVAALSLLAEGDTTRRIWLYDTFAGMTRPTARDTHRWTGRHRWAEQDARKIWQQSEKKDHNEWCYASLDEVRRNLVGTGYPQSQIEFVKGDVGATLSSGGPAKIALLRLDTDWYESTRTALQLLYPRLSEKGVFIIDDYGVWAGARQAVDEYFAEQKINPLLQRTDYTGRMGLKL